MLTNKTGCFHKSHSFVTVLSDCHQLFMRILRTSFQKLPPKFVTYGNMKKTSTGVIFSEVLSYNGLLKQKSFQAKHASFMTTELSKELRTNPRQKTVT